MEYRGTHKATTLYRIGDRVFSLDNVQWIDMAYAPARHNLHKPPSAEMGVQIITLSGHQLPPFWDAEARVLRGFLTGGEVGVRRLERPGLTVLTLVPELEPTPEPAPEDIRWDGEPITTEQFLAKLAEMQPERAPTWDGKTMHDRATAGEKIRQEIAEMRDSIIT